MGWPAVAPAAVQDLAAFLLLRVGLKLTADGSAGLRSAIAARTEALGLESASDYVRHLEGADGGEELRALLPLVTVGKTEFFRDPRQFVGFEEVLLPEALRLARIERRPLRLWSAGCATGEEPWSLAMAVAERGGAQGEVDVLATDLNPQAIDFARRATYPARRLVGLSDERLARFFVEGDGGFQVAPSLRPLVRFAPLNLASGAWGGVVAGSLDVIFCRNVIIYFDRPTIIDVMERFYAALRPGGVLALGYSESLFRLPTRFAMFEVRGTFFYRRPQAGVDSPGASLRAELPTGGRDDGSGREGASAPPAVRSSAPPAVRSSAPPAVRSSAPRAPTASAPASAAPLQRRPAAAPTSMPTPLPVPASSVVARALLGTPGGPAASPPGSPRSISERLTFVARLAEAGDFPRALRAAHLIVQDASDHLHARLTLGNLHALMGSVEEAQLEYAMALAIDPVCADAHLFQAMAHLQGARASDARESLRRALYLEPDSCLAQYLLGQVCERTGDLEAARRSYRNAAALRRGAPRPLLGHFPDLPRTNEELARAARYRLAALGERDVVS